MFHAMDGPNGEIVATASEGTGAFTYTINSAGPQTSGTFSGLPAGIYIITATDGINPPCSTDPIQVTQPDPLQVIASFTSPACSGSELFLLSSVSGGTPGYSYSWTGVDGFTSILPNPSIPNASLSKSGIYSVTVTDALGCTDIDQVDVTVNPILPVSVSITASSTTICQDSEVTFKALPVNGGTSPVYQWKLNGSVTGPGSDTLYHPL